MEGNSILHAFNNIYFAIFALFCFKLLIKISLALLTHFYIVKGNRKEAARIAEEIYGIAPGSWADRSPLHEAAFQGRLLSLKTLIAQGFNVNIVTIDRVSALHEACLGGHVTCAKVLLENGAQVNAVTVDGITPLFNACCSGSAACVNMLLEFGATPQLENHLASPIHEAVKRGASVDLGKRLDTPLHAAVRKSSAEAVNLLTDYGASLTRRNAEFKCALDLAAPNSKVEQALLLREGPASLAQLCRLCIRKCLGRSCLYVVHKLNLPEPLEKFLLYR
ncbi:ankyrin repeat and SOCS box protein 11 isoform X3 [Trachemys scripta elegans]|uniref:ankyrin repeat and SOCS box protein 11 isoform X3 n=1 Tax=Trachemys scripta elegans TaxID=31138 RepID=UPI001551C852|nr:ankyrin repeat and SOCS box protein 11 isoform X3 [Trachemys scripta elegans]